MSFFGLTSLLTAVLSLIIGLFVIWKNSQSLLNKSWFFVSMAASTWAFSLFGVVESEIQSTALFFQYILDIGGIIIPLFFFLFVLRLLNLYDNLKKIFYLSVVFCCFLILVSFTSLFKLGVSSKFGFNFWIDTGPLYILFPLFFGILVTASVYLMLRNIPKLFGAKKQQVIYVLLTALFGFGGGLTNFFPQLIGTYPFGNFFTIFYVGGISYAIAKYRLMDIRLVISKSILYVALVGAVTFIFTMATLLTGEIFVGISGISSTLITFIVSLIIVLGIDPLKRSLSNITDKIFYRGKIDYQNVLKKLSEITAKEIDLEKLLIDLSHNIEKLLKYKSVDFLYKSNSSGIYRGIINKEEIVTDKEEIVGYLKNIKEIIIVEELEIKTRETSGEEKKYLFSIAKRLQKMNIGLIAPIISEDRVIAFFTVNKKLSDDIFSSQDLNLISVLVPQIANALEKAKLYNEVQEFNIKLQEKVDKATEDLKHANGDLETRNQYLTALQKVSNIISRSLDFTEVVQFIANSIKTEIGFVAGIIDFIDTESKSIYIGAMTRDKIIDKAIAVLPKDPLDYKVSLSENDNISVKAINSGQILKTNKLHDLLRPAVGSKLSLIIQKVLNINSIVSIPVYSENKIIGAIDFFLKRQLSEIKDIDLEVMKSLADQTGLVIGNIRLYEQIKEKNVALKQANVHLKKLDEAKSEFLSIASHQLRTPLTGIKGYLSMILEGDYGKLDKKQEKIVRDVFNASDRMSRLINVFLNVSRIESGRLKLDYVDVNLEDLINQCIKDLKSTAQDKGLKLNFKYQKKYLPLVSADSDKMKDVILNLIDNAIKYTHKGKIDVRLLKDGENRALVQVEDTGIGLAKTEIVKLFNKFSRGDGISKINTGGSGLGLYIVKRIIEEHGGKVWVESKGSGKGSIFQFTLPINK